MWTVVVAAMPSDIPNSIQVTLSVPFRLSLTELLTNMDINGSAPLSEVLETVILEELIIVLWIGTVVDEMDISTGSIFPIKVSLHCKVL